MKNLKYSDVQSMRSKSRAEVECEGDGITPCSWTPFMPIDDREIRQEVKHHVQYHPYHVVLVTVTDVTTYYIPKRLLGEEQQK